MPLDVRVRIQMIKEASLFFLGRFLGMSGSSEVQMICSIHTSWLIVSVVGASTQDHRSEGYNRPVSEGHRGGSWRLAEQCQGGASPDRPTFGHEHGSCYCNQRDHRRVSIYAGNAYGRWRVCIMRSALAHSARAAWDKGVLGETPGWAEGVDDHRVRYSRVDRKGGRVV